MKQQRNSSSVRLSLLAVSSLSARHTPQERRPVHLAIIAAARWKGSDATVKRIQCHRRAFEDYEGNL
ncbi:hypothetical protein E2C01_059389 [Portunus trituberculatus]|uniref:Uncharacterized protein n=1 Tax=Portunus trituberculatus TaxID=210409 RepID=A0A5B7H5P8_PORTR|nr:hypothetical protein [Portunus trituberculatus]